MESKNVAAVKSLGPVVAGLVFLATVNMRPAITSVGPLLDEISFSFGLSPTLLGLLGSMPLLMFALISPASAFFSSKLGIDRVMFIALLAIASGIIIRSYLGLPGLWIGVALATAAIAVANVLVPALVRRDFPKHVSLATGVYSATMGLGASAASALAVPIAENKGWQFSLAIWAVPAIVVASLWLLRINASTPQRVIEARVKVSVWRTPAAWWLTLFMGVQSASFYFMVTWLPAIQVAAGKTPTEAGITLSGLQIVGIIAGLLLPYTMRGKASFVPATLTASIPLMIGFAGLVMFPNLGEVWALILGVGAGSSLVVSLTLIATRGSTELGTAQLSGMVQSIGYLIAALVPVAAGILKELTGGWEAPLIMMLCIATLQTSIAVVVGRGRTTSKFTT
ncbi:MAG TPA: MFS transporter [Microbacteriaceae bacterium]|nr:MFS transporter [Microbacteriaceae bacterium]